MEGDTKESGEQLEGDFESWRCRRGGGGVDVNDFYVILIEMFFFVREAKSTDRRP